jgi:hypothetical protein
MANASIPPADLILHRLVMAAFRPAPSRSLNVQATYGDAEVTTLGSWEGSGALRVLLAGSVNLEHRPKLTRESYVVVPDRPRRTCELALEAIADLLSIGDRCSRSIASPFPWVAFEPTSDAASEWLGEARGIHELGRTVDLPSPFSPVPLHDEIRDGLKDRSDGVILLAEALAQGHPSGQFRELVRVFERAFGLSAGQLVEALLGFLHSAYGYTEEELKGWRRLRDAATHADVRKRFVVEADVRPVLGRVMQAAYDVLLNKRNWRDPSLARRQLWTPTAWTRGPSGEVRLRQYSTPKLTAQLLDQFGAYPTDLGGVIQKLPKAWWAPRVDSSKSPQRRFEVVAADKEFG